MRKVILYIITQTLFFIKISSQDIHLTQFYNNPIFLNSSYTGLNIDSRVTLNYRTQWINIPGNYRTFFASYDQLLYKFNSGIGILLMNDLAGSMNFGTRCVGFNYAYHIKLNYEWKISVGIKTMYSYRTLDFEKLIFPDQLQRMSSYTLQPVLPSKESYFDISSGISVSSYYRTFGFSIDHINKPENSFKSNNYYIPLKISIHFAYSIFTKSRGSGRKEEIPIILLLNQFKLQSKFIQNEIGAIYKTTSYGAGVIYRGIPFAKSYQNYIINDAIALFFSIQYKFLEITYSYDITISTLTIKSGGSHEACLIYKFYNPEKNRKPKAKVLPCSKF